MDSIRELTRTDAWREMLANLEEKADIRKETVILKARNLGGNLTSYHVGVFDGFNQCIDILKSFAKRREDGK